MARLGCAKPPARSRCWSGFSVQPSDPRLIDVLKGLLRIDRALLMWCKGHLTYCRGRMYYSQKNLHVS